MPKSRFTSSSKGIIVSAATEIREGLQIAAAEQRFALGRSPAQPLRIEGGCAVLGQSSVLLHAVLACLRKLRREHQERSEHDTQDDDDERHGFDAKIRELSAGIEDAVRERARDHHAMRDGERYECVHRVGEEAEPAEAIGVGRDQAPLDTRRATPRCP